jgi:hypothetical protein
MWSRPAWAKSKVLALKVSRAKKAGGMAGAVECLPCKYEALSEFKFQYCPKQQQQQKPKKIKNNIPTPNHLIQNWLLFLRFGDIDA